MLARRLLFALFLVGTGSYAVVQMRGPEGLSDLRAKYEQTRTLRARLVDQQEKNRKIQKMIEKLSDRDVLDKIQREDGKVPPGTILFHVEEPKEEAPAPR
jgi:cell division protein FtsB